MTVKQKLTNAFPPFAVATLGASARLRCRPHWAVWSALATFFTAAALSCAQVDVGMATNPAPSEMAPTCTLDNRPSVRPAEYAGTPEPDVMWVYRTDVGSAFAPTLDRNALFIATHANIIYSLEPATGKLRWSREVAGVPTAPPSVVDGVVYVSGELRYEHNPETGVMFALDASSGDQLWKFDIPRGSWVEVWAPLRADPVLAGGMVYVGSFNGSMYALDAANGELRWSYEAGDVISSPAVVVRDTVYFGSKDSQVYALDAATGVLRWSYKTAGELWEGPIVVGGLVYQGPGDPYLYALDAGTGELRWSHATDAPRWSRPVVADGILYATAGADLSEVYQQRSDLERYRHHGYVTALDARSGRPLWQYRTVGDPSAPVVSDGVVYVSAGDERSYLPGDPPETGNPAMRGHLYAINATTGDLVWQRRMVAEIGAGFRGLSVADGTVYVESYDLFRYPDRGAPPPPPFHGQVSAFDARTGEIKWLLEIDDTFAEPPTVHHGVAYMASSNGAVCAVRAPS